MARHVVWIGDCLESLRQMEDQSVNCCVTSPPYFGLRDYDVDGQIGLEDTPDAYVARLVEVFREVRRVLRDDGVVFLNLGDSYFGGGGGGGSKGSKQQTNKGALIPGHTRAGARRAAAYGTSGKAPEGSQASDCLCGSLCDACRRAYQIGKSHSGGRRVPTLAPSIASSIPEHTGSPSGHLPTSGLTPPADHSEAAIRGLVPSAPREDGPPRDALVSTPPESSQQLPGANRRSDQPSECQLCGRSLRGSAPASARMAECSCGTSRRALASGISGMDAASSAYQYLTTESLKPKDLIGIPWRVAFALQADGWYLRQDIIWHKPNPMPESVTDRCTKAHEYLFMLSKSARYFYDAEAMAEPVADSTIARVSKPTLAAQAGSDRVPGKTNGPMKAVIRKQDGHGRRHAGFNDRFFGQDTAKPTRNRRSVWTVTTKPFKGAHFATFPPDLIEPCILAGCPRGGTVLDPFGGSGTTAGVAVKHGRNAILCELNPKYVGMIRGRVLSIAGDIPDMLREAAE